MERSVPNEKRLRSLYWSKKANSPVERLEIAHIFKQTNFGLGKECKLPFLFYQRNSPNHLFVIWLNVKWSFIIRSLSKSFKLLNINVFFDWYSTQSIIGINQETVRTIWEGITCTIQSDKWKIKNARNKLRSW